MENGCCWLSTTDQIKLVRGFCWVVCLSGVGRRVGTPGVGGPWHGDTFEGGYYEGEWEGVNNVRHSRALFSPPRHCFFSASSTQTETFLALMLCCWALSLLSLSHPLPLPLCPALVRSRWLGDTAIFCFLLYNLVCRAFPLTVRGCLCALSCDVVGACRA